MISQEEAIPLLLKNTDEDNNKSKQPIYFNNILVYPEKLDFTHGEKDYFHSLSEKIPFTERLRDHINQLFNEADKSHKNYINDLNTITCILTPEFSLYGKEPLSLKEYSKLVAFVENIAAQHQENIHVLLSSFSVKFPYADEENKEQNTVLNLCLYVQCGNTPIITPFAKSFAAHNDNSYSGLPNFSQQPTDSKTLHPSYLPFSNFIASRNQTTENVISFDSIIPIVTKGGAKGIIVIDICFEHTTLKASKQLFKFLNGEYNIHNINHIVTSNGILAYKAYVVSDFVINLDAKHSRQFNIINKARVIGHMPGEINPDDIVPPAVCDTEIQQNQDKSLVTHPSIGPAYIIDPQPLKKSGNIIITNIFYGALLHGDIDTISFFLKQINNINRKDHYYGSFLHFAIAINRDPVIVKLMLDYGAEPNIIDNHNNTPLHIACLYGNKNAVLLLLQHKEHNSNNINMYNNDGNASLHIAAYRNHLDIIKTLIFYKANIEYRNRYYDTPLHSACLTGNIETVKLLLEYKADINAIGFENNTSLHFAIQKNHGEIIKTLIFAKASLNEKNIHGYTPLHLACQSGNIEAVKLLLEHNADIDSLDCYDNTSLHLAIENNHLEIVKILLDQKAKHNISNQFKNTALNLACSTGNIEIVSLLLDHNADINAKGLDDYTPLLDAIDKNHFDIVEFLLSKNANPSIPNQWGNNALHIACKIGNKNIVLLLLKKFPHIIDIQGGDANTSLHLAVDNNHTDIAKILISYNAGTSHKNKWNSAPLHLACSTGNIEIVSLILEHNPNIIDEPGCDNYTPLHFSINRNNLHIAHFLLFHYKANLHAKNIHGDTPLHLACSSGNLDAVKLLLEYGADLNAIGCNNYTPLQYAIENNHLEIAKFLLSYKTPKADPNIPNQWGNTPLHRACMLGNSEAVKLLLEHNADINATNNAGEKPIAIAIKLKNYEITGIFHEYTIKFLNLKSSVSNYTLGIFPPHRQSNLNPQPPQFTPPTGYLPSTKPPNKFN